MLGELTDVIVVTVCLDEEVRFDTSVVQRSVAVIGNWPRLKEHPKGFDSNGRIASSAAASRINDEDNRIV